MGTSSLRCSFFLILIFPHSITPTNDQLSCITELEASQVVKNSIVKCRYSTLDSVTKSLASLVPIKDALPNTGPLLLNVSTVDISECDIPTLPNLFAQFKESIEVVRVANSQVQYVAGNAFTGLENRLKWLDMSGNKLAALPSSLQLLKNLHHLDISDNQIRVLPPDFTQSPLKHLDISFNLLGFAQGGPAGPRASSKSVPRLEVAEDVFDVTSVAGSLQVLDLGFNGLNVVPKQLLDKSGVSFPKLRVLGLSGNRVSDVPKSLVEGLGDLQVLRLDSNLIRSVKMEPFPGSVKLLTLKDNPLQCNCDIMWLLDLLFRNSTLTVHLPSCSTPFYLRDLTLANINDRRLCPSAPSKDAPPPAPNVVYVTDRDLALFHLGLFQSLHLMDVQGENQALFISWKIDPDFYAFPNLEWAVILRRFDSSIYDFQHTQFTLSNYQKNQPVKEGSIYSDSVRDLTPSQFYVVCIAAVEGDVHYVHLNNCKGATTLQESPQPVHTSFIASDHTITTPVTTAITTEEPQGRSERINFNLTSTPSTDAITLEWTVFDHEPVWETEKHTSPLDFKSLFTRPNYLWRVKLRLFGSERLVKDELITDPVDAVKPTLNHTSGTSIGGLAASSAYVLCVSLLQTPAQRTREETQDEEKCFEVLTESKHPGTYSLAQMATASVASSVSAAICTGLVALCVKFRNQRAEEEGEGESQVQLPISDLLQRSSSVRMGVVNAATTSS